MIKILIPMRLRIFYQTMRYIFSEMCLLKEILFYPYIRKKNNCYILLDISNTEKDICVKLMRLTKFVK